MKHSPPLSGKPLASAPKNTKNSFSILHPGKIIHHYKILQHLNYGSYGTVVLAKNLRFKRSLLKSSIPELVAIKCVHQATDQNPNDTEIEAKILFKIAENASADSKLKTGAANVVKCLDTFSDKNFVFFVLEYCSMGDVYEALTIGKLPSSTNAPDTIRSIMIQLIEGIEFLHNLGIYHRDLKPENLLLFLEESGNVTLKISDFGLSTLSPTVHDYGTGSERYMAPEQYEESSHYSLPSGGYEASKSDLWAIGICFLNILFSKNPFKVPSVRDPIFSDFAVNPESLFDVFPTLSHDSFNVLKCCLALNPKRRNLTQIKEAVLSVTTWTTEDEAADIIDDFEELGVDFHTKIQFDKDNFDDVPVTTANRQPLRTPSIANLAETSAETEVKTVASLEFESFSLKQSDESKISVLDTVSPSSEFGFFNNFNCDLRSNPQWDYTDFRDTKYIRNTENTSFDYKTVQQVDNDVYKNAKPIPRLTPIFRNRDNYQFATSAPMASAFANNNGTKDRLKFGRSWCDLTESDDDDEVFSADSTNFNSFRTDDNSSQKSEYSVTSNNSLKNPALNDIKHTFAAEWEEHVYNEIM